MTDEIYCYPPDYRVLRNKLDLRDAKQLDYYEREFVADRIEKGCPTGDFDLAHLKAIHHHLFQDVYGLGGRNPSVGNQQRADAVHAAPIH
ncbi:hypothetical protein [Pseudaestuariivita rosea]|uniref:hypothetical protein n=1 Tax=Pseudaestuariivita rosea TaxID=2763263 RepID=UPI001ABB321D|nr:hypothetical protein [Pseudaestuariivita rosea]